MDDNVTGLSPVCPQGAVNAISTIRVDCITLLDKVESLLAELAKTRHPAGRELALTKTKLQEARMWAGMALSHFDTDFVPSDIPSDPESKSKLKHDS